MQNNLFRIIIFVAFAAGGGFLRADDRAIASVGQDTALEYAVEHLGARLIVVVGHARCGAVAAAVASETAPGIAGSLKAHRLAKMLS